METNNDAGNNGHLAAIYVHAGAGYHSRTNEEIHLDACATAAKLGMALMKNGGSSLDAVEIAIRCLEDNDVTNAGYGSNLTMDGTVEGDATIVDHLGRSGAVGALANVRNPVSVARLVYEESTKPMVLKRVPPNLLTGQGAANFAQSHGMELEPGRTLISPGAQERFRKWKIEIEMAKQVERLGTDIEQPGTPNTRSEYRDVTEAVEYGPALSQNPTIAALGNESQSFSPEKVSKTWGTADPFLQQAGRRIAVAPFKGDRSLDVRKRNRAEMEEDDRQVGCIDQMRPAHKGHGNEAIDLPDRSLQFASSKSLHDDLDRTRVPATMPPMTHSRQLGGGNEAAADDIIDTVGAIAIDNRGRIAAASSSGGIGMKHPGRTGPAALVGIGSAVIPVDPDDADQTTVACVSSGTGEHMATTLAAHTCAHRLHTCTKSARGGKLVETDEDDAIKNFVHKDFMGHPSIRTSFSQGAIGLMLVKKSRDGMWLYWVHNTESFALASMHAGDAEPHTVMSRSTKAGRVVTGARSMRLSDAGTLLSSKTKRGKGGKAAKSVKTREVLAQEGPPPFRFLQSASRRRRRSANPPFQDQNVTGENTFQHQSRRDLAAADALDDES